ncbi:hypothetical protein AV944_06915 [Sphingomonas sp. LK11]|nr:hypothetical protein AV944_06915 [Sphingomonas sp. LK11]
MIHGCGKVIATVTRTIHSRLATALVRSQSEKRLREHIQIMRSLLVVRHCQCPSYRCRAERIMLAMSLPG